LNFFDATTGKQQKSIIAMKDVDWDSWSLTLGWPVQGLWPSIPDGTDVVACDRSHSGMVVASSDTYGRVRLSRYPCVSAVLKHVLKSIPLKSTKSHSFFFLLSSFFFLLLSRCCKMVHI